MVRRKHSEAPNVFNFTSLPFYGGLDPLGKDADNEVRRWFKLIADIEHNRMPTENDSLPPDPPSTRRAGRHQAPNSAHR